MADRKRLHAQASRPQRNSHREALRLQRIGDTLRDAEGLFEPAYVAPPSDCKTVKLQSYAPPARALRKAAEGNAAVAVQLLQWRNTAGPILAPPRSEIHSSAQSVVRSVPEAQDEDQK